MASHSIDFTLEAIGYLKSAVGAKDDNARTHYLVLTTTALNRAREERNREHNQAADETSPLNATPIAPTKRSQSPMSETFASINLWQRETFPKATIDGVLNHIDEEWKEFKEATTVTSRIEEAVDLIILLSCYVDKASGIAAQIFVDYKMKRNRDRQWNIQPDGTGRHV